MIGGRSLRAASEGAGTIGLGIGEVCGITDTGGVTGAGWVMRGTSGSIGSIGGGWLEGLLGPAFFADLLALSTEPTDRVRDADVAGDGGDEPRPTTG